MADDNLNAAPALAPQLVVVPAPAPQNPPAPSSGADRLQEFLQEDNGGFSATRLALLLWVVGVLVVWAYGVIIKQGAIPVIDDKIVTILGILMTGKVVQKFKEAPGPGA